MVGWLDGEGVVGSLVLEGEEGIGTLRIGWNKLGQEWIGSSLGFRSQERVGGWLLGLHLRQVGCSSGGRHDGGVQRR